MGSGDRPVVAIWRSRWLPPSETFIRDHVSTLNRWQPLKLGLFDEPSSLGMGADFAPFHRTGLGRYFHSVASRTQYWGVYRGIIQQYQPLLLHAHFGPDAVTALPIARRYGLPLVVTFHGYDLTRQAHGDLAGPYLRGLHEVFDEADLLLPASRFLASRLLELGAPASKVHVHYLGIPLGERVGEPAAPRSGVLFVGRLTEGKGVRDLMSAYRQLPARLRALHPLRIVGEGPMGAQLRQTVAEMHQGQITFAGWQTPESVAASMRSASAFCAPSHTAADGWTEGFGLVFLEAAREGLPVVSYATGGIPEAVEDGVTGLLAAEGDVAGLSERLESILRDVDLAHEMGQAGQRRVEEFDVVKQTALLEDIYDRITHQPRP